MIKHKRALESDSVEKTPSKKIKKEALNKNSKFKIKDNKSKEKTLKGPNKDKLQKSISSVQFSTDGKPNWTDVKKQKKDLRLKRKQNKACFDVIVEAKVIGEILRQKHLKGGKEERNELVTQLHNLLVGKELYAKLVLTHDVARLVQYLLKFGSETIRNSIAKEIIPVSTDMLMSKYGRYCFKNMLKYGNTEIRSLAITKLYGNAVKLCSHVVSAAVFEYAYTTWATQLQKQHFIQEFFGDMYKQSKDNTVKHLKDVYKGNDSLKAAALNATKTNLSRIFNKNLFDSGLVQSVLYQYMSECSPNDKTELISQLSSHSVILSNSKDGARVVMQCIWHGSNKDKKTIVKAVKENLLELSKHEFAHCVVITLLDSVDDTVLLNKTLVSQIVSNANDLVVNEWGRKVLLWLIAPGDHVHFHPIFVNELSVGQQNSTSRKDSSTRRSEILSYCSTDLLKYITADARFWLSTASIALVTVAILKSGADVSDALVSVAQCISDPEWKIKENDKEILGIEHSGFHMALKKLIQHDKVATNATFGQILLSSISEKTIKKWLKLNRGCFLLVAVYENGNAAVQQEIKEKLGSFIYILKNQNSAGAKILLDKIL